MNRLRFQNTFVAAFVAASLSSLTTEAKDVWTSKDGESSLEVNAFYKAFATGLRMRSGLVDGSKAIETLVASVRESLPPEQASLVPEVRAIPLYGGTSTHNARIWSRLVLRDRFEFLAAWQLGAIIASDPAFAASASLGSAVPARFTQGANRRLVDFDRVITQESGLVLLNNLDQLAFKVRLSGANLTIGRQVLSWGSGRFWNPTDLLSPFAPTDIDREVRRGIDAFRASIPLAETIQLEVLVLPQLELRNVGGVLRTQVNVKGFDIAPSVAKYMRDSVIGLDVTGDIGPVGVHGEAAWTSAFDRNPGKAPERFLRAVVGADLRPLDDLVLTGEYYYNGWGASDTSGYLGVLRSDRVLRGEVFGAGKHYVGLAASWQASELLSVAGSVIANVQDPSVLIAPAIEYWAEQSLLLRFGGYVPFGRAPDVAPLQQLTPNDLLLQTDAWRNATRGFGLRSEYGASAFGMFVQLAIRLL